jgi:hypothetical protein
MQCLGIEAAIRGYLSILKISFLHAKNDRVRAELEQKKN